MFGVLAIYCVFIWHELVCFGGFYVFGGKISLLFGFYCAFALFFIGLNLNQLIGYWGHPGHDFVCFGAVCRMNVTRYNLVCFGYSVGTSFIGSG